MVVSLLHAEGGVPGAILQGLVAEFDRANPGITVEVEQISGGREGVLERWRQTEPGERPSLAVLAENTTRLMADSGQTVAPGRCLAEVVPDVLPVIEASWSVDGLVQAVPFAVSTPVLLYDRWAFADAGLDPDDPPATIAELRAAAERLVGRDVVPVGLAFDVGPQGGGSWFVEQWNALAGVLSVGPANGRGEGGGARPVTAAWADGPTAEHLAWLHEMVADGLARSVGRNLSGIADLVAFFGDPPQVAMALHTSASLGQVGDLLALGQPDTVDLAVAPLPGPGTGAGSLPGGTALWLADGRSAEETTAAWSLAAFLASPRAQARWAAATGYVPISRSAARTEPLPSTWAERPQLAVAYRVLAAQGTSVAELGMSVGPERQIEDLLATVVEAAVSGEDPADALAAAAEDADRLLAAYAAGLSVSAPAGR